MEEWDYEESDWYIPPIPRLIIVIFFSVALFSLQPNDRMNDFGIWITTHKEFFYVLFGMCGSIAILEIINQR